MNHTIWAFGRRTERSGFLTLYHLKIPGLAVLLLCLQLRVSGQKLPPIQPPTPKYLYSEMEIQSDQFRSSLTVSAQMPIAELETQLNKALTGLIYEDKSYEDDDGDNLKAKVWKLGNIKIEAVGNHFLFDMPLKIWASAGYKFSPLGYTLEGYKDTEFKLRVKLISEISFSKDWQLVSQTRVDSYDWITEPSVSVAGFSIPIKGMISRLLNKNAAKITRAIDKAVRENIHFKDKIEAAWGLAQEPVKVSEAYHTWLINSPESVEAQLPNAHDGYLNLNVGIKGFTQTIISSIPPVRSTVVKLPPLKIVDNLPQLFNIGLISSISYEEASKMAEEYFRDKTYYFSGKKYSVRIKEIELYGQEDHLIIKAGLLGSITGNVYLRGVPQFDPVTKSVYLDQLEYDLDTRSVLIKAANWLLHGKFLRMMREAMVFPVGKEMDSLTESVRTTMAEHVISEGIVLKGSLNEAVPDKINLTPGHIYTVIRATGKLDLHVQKINY
ncbi:DUF4403 family protein [Ravibacter arvi]